MSQTFIRVAGVVAVCVLVALAALAQNESAKSLHGQTFDKSGTPLAKAVVYLKNTKTLQVRSQYSDESGTFQFQSLAPNTDYEVHAEHEGASSGVKTISSFDSRKEIHVSLKLDKK